jgi:O-antigen ligase
MVLVCMLALLWDWFERLSKKERLPFLERYMTPAMAVFSYYVLYQSGSKTSLLCLIIGGIIISAIRFEPLRRRINRFGVYLLGSAILFFWIDSYVGVSEVIVTFLGRDMTFTGRTDVWRELLAVGTDPLYGTGFMSFWDDREFQSKLPYWVGSSSHNGYLEVYLAGGALGIIMLSQMLFFTAVRLNRELNLGTNYAIVRFSIFVVALIANFSESNFVMMTPIGLLLTLAAIGTVPRTVPIPAIPYPHDRRTASEGARRQRTRPASSS